MAAPVDGLRRMRSGRHGGAGRGDGRHDGDRCHPDQRGPSAGLLDDGTLYVSDAMASEIRAFRVDGTFRGSWGRVGDGPGEFRYLTGVLVDSAKTVWAEDSQLKRITGFASNGTISTMPNVQRGGGGSISWLGILTDEGLLLDYEYFDSRSRTRDGRRRGPQIVKASLRDQALVRLDSVTLPYVERPPYRSVRRKGFVELVSPPFWPTRLSAIAPDGTFWVNDQPDYVVHRVGFGGDTLTSIVVRGEAPRVTSAERDSAAQASGFSEGEIPRVKQVLRSLAVDSRGRLWAELRAHDPGFREWDVWTLDGVRLRVRSRIGYRRVPPWMITEDTVVGVTTDSLDRPSVTLSLVRRGSG